jgi:hypothetical protein
MQLSAEIRWFWQDSPPPGLGSWFRSPGYEVFPPGGDGSKPREDEYLREENRCELGIKVRGKNGHGVEIKGLVVTELGDLSIDPFKGTLELWCKWISSALELKPGSTVMILKWRLLRKFDTSGLAPREIELGEDEMPKDPAVTLPEQGCNVELTRIHIPINDETWWTLGFESFGTLSKVEKNLQSAAEMLASRRCPGLDGGFQGSYPAWLKARILPML